MFDTSTKPAIRDSCFRIDVTKGCEKDYVEAPFQKENLVILHTKDLKKD